MTYVYIRVSTDKQDGTNQKLGIEELCKRKELKIDRYIDDEGVSGTKEPDKRKLGRSLFMIMRILEECMNKGVKLYTVKDGYELGDNITSKVLAFAFGLSAEIERNLISQRTKVALGNTKGERCRFGTTSRKKKCKGKTFWTRRRNSRIVRSKSSKTANRSKNGC